VKTHATLVNYAAIPLSVDNAIVAADNHILLCGNDQADVDAKSNANDDKPAATRYYDLSAGGYLNGAGLQRVPKAFRTACATPPLSLPALVCSRR
jgi:hypothetical protein